MPLRALFIDFNAYFASVEQQLRPELRGVPVAVVPVLADTSCCIAASYEAKRHGVKTGTGVAEARRMCRGIRLVLARHAEYVHYHHRLVAAVEQCLPVKQVLSIDEMYCELIGRERQRAVAEALAARIKAHIAASVGEQLRCSIGIAPNPFLAKIATDMQKPDGLVVLEDADLPRRLHALDLRDLPGLGPRLEQRLRRLGIDSVEALYAADKNLLRVAWGGIEGERMYDRLRGTEVHTPPTRRSSVGHSHVLAPDMRSADRAYAVLNKLLQKAAARLRHDRYLAGGLVLQLRHLRGDDWRAQRNFDHTDDTRILLGVLAALWAERPGMPAGQLLGVGVSLGRLIEARHATRSLFDDDQRRISLHAAVDAINAKYGRQTIFYGGAQKARQDAPMRIAFTHIPDLRLEGDD